MDISVSSLAPLSLANVASFSVLAAMPPAFTTLRLAEQRGYFFRRAGGSVKIEFSRPLAAVPLSAHYRHSLRGLA